MFDIDIVSDADEWETIAEQLSGPRVYASHRVVKASERLEKHTQAEAVVVSIAGDSLFHPYMKRLIPGGTDLYDLASPYEFGGFWFSTDDTYIRRRLLRCFNDQFPILARERGVVCEFARMHPWLSDQPAERDGAGVAAHGSHASVDLCRGYREISRLYSRSTRKQVRQGHDNGLCIRETSDLSSFCSIFYESMRRLGANPYYFFPIEFFSDIQEFLHCFLIYTAEGEPCGAHVYLMDYPIVYAFLCHSVPRFNHLRVNNFGYDRMIERAVEMGFKTLHLGGGHPSLFHFKKGFATDVMPHYHLRRICQPACYAELASMTVAEALGKSARGFFPAYRDPSADNVKERNLEHG